MSKLLTHSKEEMQMMRIICTLCFCLLATQLTAQWSNRYPKLEGYRHHVYLEGYELPILTSGPMDPAPSPKGGEILFAAKGWLWLMDLSSANAKRITSSGGMDSRPEWSPDGSKIAFVRDDGSGLKIIELELSNMEERVLVQEDAINLDPSYSPDGSLIYYASSVDKSIDLWKINVDAGAKEKITSQRSIERRPIAHPSGDQIVYLSKSGSYNAIEMLNLNTAELTTLVNDRITSQVDITLSPDGQYMVYNWPFDSGYELRVLSLTTPNTSILLTQSDRMPLAPAFDATGEWIYFSEATDNESTALKRIKLDGGEVERLVVKNWDYGSDVGMLKIRTLVDGVEEPVRLNILDEKGHPLIPQSGTVHSEGQTGRVFFYSSGTLEIVNVAGEVTISAVQGFTTQEVVQKTTIRSGTTSNETIDLKRIWNPKANGWYAGDNHFHLNYGGTYRLDPEDIVPEIEGEGMDVAVPLLANLHNRFLQQDLWGWKRDKSPIITFGQEVRSHFLGHVELIATDDLFWPWIWGPGYQVHATDDRINATALRHARAQGGVGGYVHPVGVDDPFGDGGTRAVPVNFIADAVLGEVDILEIACLWSNELGTASIWHEILNLGIPLAASAGSDVMNDFYRTMTIGATRVYVKPTGNLTFESYLDALKKGRSFVTTGPLLEFTIEGNEPGQVIENGLRKSKWNLNVHSALPYESVELFVNGTVVWSTKGDEAAGSRTYKGSINLPHGGWVTARVHGGEVAWPSLNSYTFAETSPVWIGSVGSVDPNASKESAKKLLEVMKGSKERLMEGYGDAPIPNLLDHFQKAREKLEAISKE